MMLYTNPNSLSFDAVGDVMMLVSFDGLGEVPFNASPNDPEAHGRELYARAIAGEFGPIAEYIAPPPPPPALPQTVSMRQARLALLESGLLDDIELAMSGMPREAQIEWEYATEVKRGSNLVAAMASVLNLDDAALDALFVSASLL